MDNRRGTKEAILADDDDEREEARPAARKPAAAPENEQVALLREMRDLMKSAHERQDRYLWMLLPVIAILLVIAIFQAMRL